MIGRITLLAGAIALFATAGRATDLVGIPRVIDADTLAFGKIHVRLIGVDAPELRQPCTQFDGSVWFPGRVATAWLRSLIRGVSVGCHGRTSDRYGRIVARCYAGGVDLGRALVAAGWAVPYMDTDNRYGATAAAARAAELGMHIGQCADPADWRHRSRP